MSGKKQWGRAGGDKPPGPGYIKAFRVKPGEWFVRLLGPGTDALVHWTPPCPEAKNGQTIPHLDTGDKCPYCRPGRTPREEHYWPCELWLGETHPGGIWETRVLVLPAAAGRLLPKGDDARGLVVKLTRGREAKSLVLVEQRPQRSTSGLGEWFDPDAWLEQLWAKWLPLVITPEGEWNPADEPPPAQPQEADTPQNRISSLLNGFAAKTGDWSSEE